jgi:tetratricopeptide (TPR) repeat protein
VCLEFAEGARKGLTGPQAGYWYSRIDAERENFLAAHKWCDHAPNGAALGLRFARSLRIYWINRGWTGLGFRFTVDALARTRPDERSSERCRALFDAGQIACFRGNYRESIPYLEESLAIARELDDKYRVAAALQPLALALLGIGETENGRKHAEEAVDLLREATNTSELAGALANYGQHLRVAGRLDEAEGAYQEALTLAGGRANEETTAIILLNLAITALLRGTPEKARAMVREVVEIEQRVGSMHGTQSLLEVCAALASALRDPLRVSRYFGAAEGIAAGTGLRRDPADEAFLAPLLEKARVALGTDAFEAGERVGRALPPQMALEDARGWLDSTTGTTTHRR